MTKTAMSSAHIMSPRILGRVEWNTIPVSGARVILKMPGNYYELPALAETTSDADGRFALENSVVGEFMIYAVSPGPEYWQWSGRSLPISAGQTVDVGALELSKVMQLLEPANGATIDSPAPVLCWAAFPEAVLYHVDVFNNTTGVAVMRRDTTDTSVVVEPELASGVMYQWSVHADNAAGLQIAYYSSWAFIVHP